MDELQEQRHLFAAIKSWDGLYEIARLPSQTFNGVLLGFIWRWTRILRGGLDNLHLDFYGLFFLFVRHDRGIDHFNLHDSTFVLGFRPGLWRAVLVVVIAHVTGNDLIAIR